MIKLIVKILDLRWAPQQQQKTEERRWEVGGGRVERVRYAPKLSAMFVVG